MTSTPYDDVFRTLLNDCSSLALPLLNEVFHEHYTGKEKIIFSPNEHFINQQDGEEEKKITDTCFVVMDDRMKRYHWECQSTEDKKILIRIFEYDAQIALDEGKMTEEILEVEFPHSAVLSLRGGEAVPDNMEVRIRTPGGAVEYQIPVLKIRKYTLEELFEKELLFLLPFYIFTYEKNFMKYEKDEEDLETLKKTYIFMIKRLDDLCLEGKCSEYDKWTILDMSKKVLESIAAKYERVLKGVREVMGGQILEHEAKTILNEGIAQGITQGIELNCVENIQKLLKKSFSVEAIADLLELELAFVKKVAQAVASYPGDNAESICKRLS